jgi:POT family proton-dependent oligopeptide transporter
MVSKMAPARILSLMMGVWFAATLPGDILAGFLGGFWSSMGKSNFFLMIASIAAFGSAAIWATSRAVGNQ